MENQILKLITESLEPQYRIVTKEEFEDRLLELSTLNDLEDDQVGYPKTNNRIVGHLDGGAEYDMYVLDREDLPNSGAFEIIIENNESEIIGFIRGTKKGNIISFNMIHIKEDSRGQGIGTSIYEKLLDREFIMKSDTEITDDTYSMYYRLLNYNYVPLIFNDGTVGLKK